MVQGPAPEFYLASMEDLYHKEESYNQWVAKLASCCTPIACSLCTLCVCVVLVCVDRISDSDIGNELPR